jgi:hypothetical protein
MPEPMGFISTPAKRSGFVEFSPVTLKRTLVHKGATFPAGLRGVIVHKHSDGIGYEVEFSHPVEAVLTLKGEDLS